MKRFLISGILCLLCSFVWAQSNDSIPNYGYGPKGNELLHELKTGLKTRELDNGTHSYTREAAEAGWGSSIWDKHNPYYTGMDLEKSRQIARQAFWIRVAKVVGIITICALIVAIIVALTKK